MNKIIILFIFLLFNSCTTNKCLDNSTIIKQLAKVFSERKKMVRDKKDLAPFDKEQKLKAQLLTKLCKQLQDEDRILILEKVPLFDSKRLGIVYLYKQNKIICFSQLGFDSIQITKNGQDYEALEKILSIVKPDFHARAARLDLFFKKVIRMDASSLNLLYLDSNDNSNTNTFYAFVYAPDVIMGDEIDSEMKSNK